MAGVFLPLRPLARYADFKGRSTRGEFWAFHLLLWLLYGGLYAWMLLPLIPVFQGQPPSVDMFGQVLTGFGFTMLAGLLLFLPALAVQVRRLHDSNRTGWWVVLPMIVSMVGQQAVYIFHAKEMMTTSMKAAEAMEAMAGTGFDLARFWEAYWPVYSFMLPWSIGPSLAASLVLLVFYLLPGSKGSNRFGDNPRGKPAT